MRKKYNYLFITIIAFYTIFCPFVGIEAKDTEEQPEVCAGPSETMAMYFQFQNEMMSAMLGSEINEKRFVTTKTDGGLFKEKFLTLGTGSINALDMIATSIRGNMQAASSSIITLTVLLSLAEASVIQSNTEGLWILTKDRVIVREYKQLLDIETSLMELAYFLSQHISLITKFEGNLLGNIKTVIKNYQELGLLEETGNLDSLDGSTIAEIMTELIVMNAYMKHFVLFNGGLGGFESSILPSFSKDAINQLKSDYRGLGVFGACNQYASNFKNTISKGVKNNEDAVKNAMEDVKLATKRLKSAFNFSYGDGASQKSNRCDMSEYEMSQLRAYRGGNRSCKTGFVNGSAVTAVQKSVTNIQEFIKEKKAQKAQKEKTTKLTKDEKKAIKYLKKIEKLETQIEKLETKVYDEKNKKGKQDKKAEKEAKKQELENKINKMLEDKKIGKEAADKMMKIIEEGAENRADEIYLIQIENKIDEAKDMNNKRNVWRELYGTGVMFSISYSGGFNSSLVEAYSDLMNNYEQSHENAISSDLSYELVNIKAILDQMDDTSNRMDELKNNLKDIAKYQCNN